MIDEQFTTFDSREEISRKILVIDDLINLQLDEILRYPESEALEANWRGL